MPPDRESKPEIIINLSSYRNKALLKTSLNNKTFSPELNEYGELSIDQKKHQNNDGMIWQYRFFISMVVFLLIMILLHNIMLLG